MNFSLRRICLLPKALGLTTILVTFAQILPSFADSAKAFCVLTRHKGVTPPEQGSCIFSQRQGNANVLFGRWAFDFPLTEEGKTYERMNREGPEAGPVFTRKGGYTLSVYWRKPQQEPGGW
jgi:hypothetical protein